MMRRAFLAGMSGFVVTGCVGGNGDGGGDGTDGGDGGNGGNETQVNPELGPVPAEYENATSVSDMERQSSDSLLSFDAVSYQSSPSSGQRCDGCMYWIPDQNGDGLGACAIIANEIEPDGWCSRYAPQS